MELLKVALLLAAFCVTHSSATDVKATWEMPEVYRRPAKILHKICLAETGASEDVLKECMDGTLHDDRGVKCYIHCIFDKIEVIDEATGRILLDRLAPLAPNEDIRAAFTHLTEKCGHIVLEDNCEKAYEVAKCYFAAHDEVVKFCHLLMADVAD